MHPEAELLKQVWEQAGLPDHTAPRAGCIAPPPKPDEWGTAEEAVAALRIFGGEGWAEYTSAVHRISDASRLEPPADCGPLLAAELARGEHSLHVRFSEGRWRGWRLEQSEGNGLLVRSVQQSRGGGQLWYDVAWTPDPDGVLRPSLARFLGFKEPGRDTEGGP